MTSALMSSPVRFWIVDNSGSMGMRDGKRAVAHSDGSFRVLTATRTDELKDAVTYQAELAALLGARTDFHHLNTPPANTHKTPKCLTLASGADHSGIKRAGPTVSTFKEAATILGRAILPCGSTPLTEAVTQIRTQLAPLAESMRAAGTRAVVVIATDGIPDNRPSFASALQQLQAAAPVWLVVRLCTSDESVVDYWTALDKQLERPLEVLDDVFGEAAEIGRYNDWLAYGAPLHAARLFGLQHKLFDLMDERSLHPSDIKDFCELLLGDEQPLPEPELDTDAFIAALKAKLEGLPPVFDPRRRRMRPWIDADMLGARLKTRSALRKLGLPKALQRCLGA